ncbi:MULTISPECIES: CYTH domain-containing protein [Winogradskyella]|uniref:CYTH domain-containing protein n=1 Tax=Winogradskyella marincola TaxID=3037795 RepID=A0ABT6FZV5_9FLAO|nr:CYTH domain-containing protein [Winogradskyella sp. YYF002]MDG4715324.1 CYTH domain-containing protein [Winogradskyella sp. YYF002]
MTVEIERKFFVTSNDFKKEASKSYTIKQGFLNRHEDRTVRVRIKKNKGFLTVKGKSSDDGLVRFEWETEILIDEAEQLLKLCENGIIDKIRYEIHIGNHIFEVDEFFGDNEGLIIAEVELMSKEEHFDKPNWLGKEVTGDIRYYNSQLSKQPYKYWK